MASLFNTENRFWIFVDKVVDGIVLNFLWLVSCLPVITAGAATTAFYYTTNKVLRNQRSKIWKEYWSSFRANFKQATKIWLIFLAAFLMSYVDIKICLGYMKIGSGIGYLAYVFYGLLALILIWFMYVFAYIARFEDKIKVILKNSAVMIFAHPVSSLLILALVLGSFFLCRMVFVTIWFLPVMAMDLINVVLEKVFRKYMTEEELLEEQENDRMRN